MISKVYISHSEEDDDLAKELGLTLWRVGLESFTGVNKKSIMLRRAERAAFGIRNSECFVPILTTNGILSRAVNQEIGYARALDQLIIPLLESGADLPFFISHLRPITFNRSAFEDALAELIRAIRDLTHLEWLRIQCPGCGEEMTQYLTPQEDVDRAMISGTYLETVCSYCESSLSLDPRTFKPQSP